MTNNKHIESFNSLFNNGFDNLNVLTFIQERNNKLTDEEFEETVRVIKECFVGITIRDKATNNQKILLLQDICNNINSTIDGVKNLSFPYLTIKIFRDIMISVKGGIMDDIETIKQSDNSTISSEKEVNILNQPPKLNAPQIAYVLSILQNKNILIKDKKPLTDVLSKYIPNKGEGIRKKLSNPESITENDFDRLTLIMNEILDEMKDFKKNNFKK